MNRTTLETLKRTENRRSINEVLSENKDKIVVVPDAKNYKSQKVRVKGGTDYYQRKYQKGV